MSRNREIKSGTEEIGITEEPTFRLTTTPWGGAPTSPSLQVYEYDADTGEYTEVTNTVLTGTASVSGERITWPKFTPPDDSIGKKYRFDQHFTVGGSPLTAYGWVVIER